MNHEDLIYPEEAYAIFGACFEVYNQMGNGFVEPVYQECLEIELGLKNIPFLPQQELGLMYRGRSLKRKYIPDFVCFGKIIVELTGLDSPWFGMMGREPRIVRMWRMMKGTPCPIRVISAISG